MRVILLFALYLWVFVSQAYAAKDFYIKNNSQTFLYINGTSGNVGISSLAPGALLDVHGTARMQGVTLTGNGASNGFVMESNSVGIGTWVAGPAIGWTQIGSNIYTTTGSNNVGIGTTTPQGGFVVTNGNVGIGTWSPVNALSVAGNVTIGGGAAYLLSANSAPSNGLIVQGNVGIGTFSPTSGVQFQVQGNTVSTAFQIASLGGSDYLFLEPSGGNGGVATMGINGAGKFGLRGNSNSVVIGNFLGDPNNGPANGLTVFGDVGLGTDIPANQLVVNGGVGIGTGSNSSYLSTFAPSGGMIVQGSVGIGTYAPTGALEIEGGNVGIGTAFTKTSALSIMRGNVGIGTWVPAGTFSVQKAAAHALSVVCWAANGAIGYCTNTVGTTGCPGNCSAL